MPDVGGTAGQAVRGVDHGWSERTLRTTVLPASESAVRAGAALVLPAAAANDGIPLHADSRLLQQVLRAEWGFTGVVLASADDVLGLAERHHVAETADAALALAIESGVHIVFGPDGSDGPGGADDMARRMLRLLVEGRLASWLVDAAVVTVLQLKLALGLFDEPVPVRPPLPRPARVALAARAAAQSAVLLTDPRAVLPIAGSGPVLVVAGGPTVETRGLVNALARRHPRRRAGRRPGRGRWHQAAAVVVVVDDPEGAEVAIGRLVATGTPCVALVGGADPRVLAPLVATTAAVVLCWQPVHVHAEAHADVLLGATEPGGRLPVPITGDGGRVVCPLGHGAGYTSVEYSHLRIAPDRGAGAAAAGRPVPGDERGRPGRQGGRAGLPARRGRLGRPHRDEPGRVHHGRARARPHRHRHAPHRRRPARRVEPGDAPRRRAGRRSRCSSAGRRPTCGCGARWWWTRRPTSPTERSTPVVAPDELSPCAWRRPPAAAARP